MADGPHSLKSSGENNEPLKTFIKKSWDCIVPALYNIEPLLDHLIANNLLQVNDRSEILAEKTPQQKARKLLEIVYCQLDERSTSVFIDCLKKCQHQYPRLKEWLMEGPDIHRGPSDIHRGPSEQKLRKQSHELCNRLGSLVTPISMKLFSKELLNPHELELIQNEVTTYSQCQKLVAVCLGKGEKACSSLYQAILEEDQFLSYEIDANKEQTSLSQVPKSILCSSPDCAKAVEETWPVLNRMSLEDSGIPGSMVSNTEFLNLREETYVSMPESKQETGPQNLQSFPVEENQQALLHEAMQLFQIDASSGMSLNICKLGVALGLPRDTVMNYLLALETADDLSQLRALINWFMDNIGDSERLKLRMRMCDRKRMELSQRGKLLLELLQQACQMQYSEEEDMHPAVIVQFILRDCLTEVQEELPFQQPNLGLVDCLQELQKNSRVDPLIVQELQEIWNEIEPSNLQQSVISVAQLVRDTFPLVHPSEHEGMFLSKRRYKCYQRLVQRVTAFKGLPVTAVRRVFTSKHSAARTAEFSDSVCRQYEDLCFKILKVLYRIKGQHSANHGTNPDNAQLSGHDLANAIHNVLSEPEFACSLFDSGVRSRILTLLDYKSILVHVPYLLTLHCNTTSLLADYLKRSESHSFQFCFEDIHIFHDVAAFHNLYSIKDPVAIDNGIEEVFRFRVSEQAPFVVRLYCRGYIDRKAFKCQEPASYLFHSTQESILREAQDLGTVIAVERQCVWLRRNVEEDLKTRLEKLLPDSQSGYIEEGTCCFLIKPLSTECDVRFIFKDNAISAKAERDADVL
ncbi:uncharacterized protein LOC122803500 isoform X2 [Protopterus annectens]|uniref:uncharacterized protein LOC122803500 isoform X2 n=1 Tax=Protopterus annectens TaxID=7888 RepID=UPI001CFB8AC8|nr:uncharacterized protein LOC122803500 isoform X2 [Protopterus annectens]